MAMRAGAMRTKATLLRPAKTRGASGEEHVAFQAAAVRWCIATMARGQEGLEAGLQVQAQRTWVLQFRYDSLVGQLAPEWRIEARGMTLLVNSVENPGNRSRELKVVCVENGI